MHMNYFLNGSAMGYGLGFSSWSPFLLVLLMVWSLFWKGLALWHSAKRGQGWWFVALLVLNTAGILEIVYLFLVLKIPTSQLFPAKK